MRLIDADELLKEFDPNGERLDPILVRSRIVQQPTAYDVEKVVAELEENILVVEVDYDDIVPESDIEEGFEIKAVEIGEAIDIVKRGGVE